MTVSPRDENDLGTYLINLTVTLDLYPNVRTSIQFFVCIFLSNVSILSFNTYPTSDSKI